MACSCKNTGTVRSYKGMVQNTIPHSVLPGESCIYCADKHVSTAYAMWCSGDALGAVIGELELARRHTILEFPTESRQIAEVILMVSARGKTEIPASLEVLQDEISRTAASQADKADKARDGQVWNQPSRPHQSVNILVGELHVCAAWRLASELGYMVPNRGMIIGDLSLAAEQLARYDYNLGIRLRDMRHRVQTTRAADLDRSWAETWEMTDAVVRRNLKEIKESQLKGFKDWLGLQ